MVTSNLNSIRICIGTDANMILPAKVLQHSILSRTKQPVEFTLMHDGHWDKVPGGVTGFSFKRWRIPWHFEYQGRAIYLDADQVVLSDIEELWHMPDNRSAANNVVWAAKKSRRFLMSVLVMDCREAGYGIDGMDRLCWNPDYLFTEKRKAIGNQKTMQGTWIKPQPIDIGYEWNHIDYYQPMVTKLLHFSDLRRQPWFQPAHPYRDIWEQELISALKSGFIQPSNLVKARSIYAKKRGLHPYYDCLMVPA